MPGINETRINGGSTAIKLLSIKSLANISTSRHNPAIRERFLKSVAAFVRSILPTDPLQVFFLLGCVFLYISPHLRFSPQDWSQSISHYGPIIFGEPNSAEGYALIVWTRMVWCCAVLLFISGTAGLFLCIRPGRRPLRNVILFVWVPAMWAVLMICVRFCVLVHNRTLQMLPDPPSTAHFVPWIAAALSRLGPGLHFSLLGIVCVSYFMIRMLTGRSSLPVSLTVSSASGPEQEDDWRRISIFVWFSVTCGFAAAVAAELPLYGLTFLLKDPVNSLLFRVIAQLQIAAGTAALAALAAWSVGRNRWSEMRQFLKLRSAGYAAAAVAIVAADWSFLRLIMYAHDRVIWAATEFGKFEAPRLVMYFLAPQWSLVGSLLLAALFEEIIFRGYLQSRFTRRYGILRGLVILGLCWAAIHFWWDFKPGWSDEQVLLQFLLRPASCVALGLVLGWTRLRSGSILPAVVIHGISNVNVFSRFDQRPSNYALFDVAFWALAAFVLFWYWPPEVEEPEAAAVGPLLPEIAG